MEDILLPKKPEITAGEGENEYVMTMGPFFHGYGHTVGNALRRVLLSSLPGAAVTAVKIKGASHEFDTLPNVKEDVLEIILNLKQLRLKMFSEEPVTLTLKKKGLGTVTAGDVDKNSDVEVVNPDLVLVNLTDKSAEIEMEITVAKGRGYLPTEERLDEKNEIGVIAIDSLYSPVRSVGYKVEDMRVGQITNYDKLTLSIETDGTVTAEEAVRHGAKVLMDHFNVVAGVGIEDTETEEEKVTEDAEEEASDETLKDKE